jgi:hypothetical protein
MIRDLFNNQKPLMIAGAISFALFIVTAALTLVDPAEILGISRWVKPMKFFISIAIFLWTMAVYFDQLPLKASLLGKLSWVMIGVFVVEMIVIAGQPLRMQRSHFNITTPLDGALFAVMGAAIALLTLVTAYITLLYLRSEFHLPRAVIWGMRLGLIVMLLGSIQGGYMSSQAGHAVGVADGGAGLPLVNWSTEGGDLRVAHFLGLHGLQAIPLFALLHQRIRPASAAWATFAFAVVYTAVFTATFVQAIYGRPFLAWI